MRKLIICIFMVLGGCLLSFAQHPSLLFTQEEVNEMREGKGTVPAFDKTLSEVLSAADAALNSPISVPIPADGGGGVVHEQHKSNYYAMFHCGVAYQLTGDKKYARYVADMLEAYARLYPTLGFHPVSLSPVPGRLFWQTLNESVWLVHTAVAYDCIYHTLSAKQRTTIEKNLFAPMADFIMDGMGDNHANNKTFNKMHNHATWATAAVGMIGFAMNREDYVNKALYGSDETGKRGGFIRQMDYLFSPDGYFTEGAYYQRYAIWPFVIFAQCIENKLPELEIFSYRDSILSKALSTLIQLSYEGEFFHINDALLKGLSAQELVYAADILYNVHPSDKSLLSVANEYQHTYLPTIGGFRVARDIARGEAAPIVYRSSVFRDGRKGDEGGIAVIRSTDPKLNSALTLKATSASTPDDGKDDNKGDNTGDSGTTTPDDKGDVVAPGKDNTSTGSNKGNGTTTTTPTAPRKNVEVSEHGEIAAAIANGTWGNEYTVCTSCGYHNWTRKGNVYVCDHCGHEVLTVKGADGVKGYAGTLAGNEPQYASTSEAQAAAEKREAAYAASIAALQAQVAAREAAYAASLGIH